MTEPANAHIKYEQPIAMTGQEMIDALRCPNEPSGEALVWDRNAESQKDMNWDFPYVHWSSGKAMLDGEFTSEQLRAIADFMDDNTPPPLCRVAASP